MSAVDQQDQSRPVCLVTGGGVRIGRAIALGLADTFDIAVHANTSTAGAEEVVADLKAQGHAAMRVTADFAEPESAVQMVEDVARHYGRIDLVVNSAALFEYDTPETFDVEQMRKLLAVNLVAPMVIAREFGKVARHDAVLVQIIDNKVYAPNPDSFSYSLAKFGVQHAVDLLAQEFAGRIRVCGIAPGVTMASKFQSPENFEKSWRHNLSGKSATPDDIVSAIRFIWQTPSMNGEIVVLDGGQHLMRLDRDIPFVVDRQR